MTADTLSHQLGFLEAIDALKGVERASPIISQTRRENAAEHSWHVAMYALVLDGHAPVGVQIDRVIRMLLLHDIVEIDAGDIPFHADHAPGMQERLERLAAERIFGLLPGHQGRRLRALWEEFEAAMTPDARFAKALDRLQPLVQNLATGGGTWSDYGLNEQQVIDRYGPQISNGAPGVWQRARRMVREFFETAGKEGGMRENRGSSR